MKKLFAVVALSILPITAAAPSAIAQGAEGAPKWMQETFPADALAAAWTEFKQVMNPNGALDDKTKELIGLGVAAQIPCPYCVYFHTMAAKHDGATDAQIKEAIAAASLTRKWSTVLNGSGYDFSEYKNQVDAFFSK